MIPRLILVLALWSMTPAPAATKPLIVGYFPNWGIYPPTNYQVSDIPAHELDVVNYAFAKVNKDGLVTMSDPEADRQAFPQLLQLKQAHPPLQTVISVGGWSLSKFFSRAARTAESRAKFTESAVAFMKQNGFDGIDIDWEFPVGGGLPGNTHNPADKHNFTLLLQSLRSALDAAGTADGKHYLLTIAAPAAASSVENIEPAAIAATVDWINLMAYDLHGTWDDTTGHAAPFHGVDSSDPNSAEASINAYLAAGVPADKLVLGVPFYGHSWKNVAATDHGLHQPAKEAGIGTDNDPEGNVTYRDLVHRLATQPSVYTRYWDATAMAPWVYAPTLNGGTFITYDDPQSIQAKMKFIRQKNLRGAMFWELSNDTKDPSTSLLQVIYNDLQ